MVVTFSRTGFLTLATVLLSLAWRIRRGPHRAWLWGAALLAPLVAFFVLPPGYLVHLITITDASSDPTGSAQDRWRDMRLALGMVTDHPLFGAGLGMDAVALNAERSSTWTSVHNVYLQYGADLGLPGLALFLALFWSCANGLRAALRRLRGDRDRLELLELTYGLQTSLTGFAVAAFFHPVAYQFPFFYFAGLAVAARGIALEET